jgi:hypothetical protein
MAIGGKMMEAENLSDSYIEKAILKLDVARAVDLKKADITPEMIRLKRAQLKLFREIKEARRVLNE